MANDILFILKARNEARRVAKQFANDMRQGGKSAKDIKNEVEKAKQATDKFSRSARKPRDEFQRIRKEVIQTRKEVNLLQSAGVRAGRAIGGAIAGGLALLASGRVFADAIETARGFEKALSDVRAVGNFTAEQIQAVSDAARDLGASTAFSAREAASGIEFLVRAGFDAQQALQAIPTALDLAIAGNIELARSADIASNILSAARLPISEFSRVGDELATVAASANVNIEQLGASFRFFGPVVGQFGFATSEAAAAIGILGNNGIQGALAGSSLRAVFTRLVRPTAQAAKAIQEAGIALEDVNPEANSLSDILRTLRDANLSAAQAVEIFGAEAQGVVNILTNSFDAFLELEETTRNSEGALKALSTVMADNLNGAIKELRSAVEEFYISLVNTGALQTFIQFLTAIVRALTPAREAFDGVVDGARDTATFMAELRDRAAELEAQMIRFQAVANEVVAVLKSLLQAAGVAAAFSALNLAFTFFTSGAAAAAAQTGVLAVAIRFLVRALTGPLGIIFLVIEGLRRLGQVTFEVGGTTVSVSQVLATAWSNIREGIVGAVSAIIDKVREIAPSFRQIFQTSIGIVQAFFQAVAAVNNAILGSFVGMVNAIGTVLSNLPAIIQNAFAAALNLGISIVQSGLNTILEGFRGFLGALDAVGSAVGIESNLAGSIGSVDLSDLKFDTSAIRDVGSEIAAGFDTALNRDYIGVAVDGARDVANAVFENGVKPVLDETAEQVRLTQRLAAGNAQRFGSGPQTGSTVITEDDDPTETTNTPSGLSSSGGGSGASPAAQARNQLNQSIQQTIQGYRDEIALLGIYGEELEFAKTIQQLQNQARQNGLELTQQQIDLLRQESEALQEATRAADTFTNGLKAGISAINEDLQTTVEFTRDFTVQAFNGMTDAIVDFVTTGKADFRGLLTDLLKSISKFLAERLVANFLNAFGAGIGGGVGGGGGGIFGAIFGRAASTGLRDGGPVTGQGGPRQDNLLRWLSNGEFVTNARDTMDFMPMLQAINSGNGFNAMGSIYRAAYQEGAREVQMNTLTALQSRDTSPTAAFNVTQNFSFPNSDIDSFRRSEGQLRARMSRLMQDADNRNN